MTNSIYKNTGYKIAPEEHFSTGETLGDSQNYSYPDKWEETERPVLDVGDRRLRLMDKAGIDLAIISLNAPAIQGIPDSRQAVEVAYTTRRSQPAPGFQLPTCLSSEASPPLPLRG